MSGGGEVVGKGANENRGADPATCSHPDVRFDSMCAKGLSSSEVRRLWPRGSHCKHCGFRGIIYASYEHYLRGDW